MDRLSVTPTTMTVQLSVQVLCESIPQLLLVFGRMDRLTWSEQKNYFLFVRYSKRNNFSFSSASILLTKTTSYASLMVHQTPENSSAKVYYQVSNTRPQSIQDCCTLSLQISVTTGLDFKPLRLLTALPKHAGVPPTLTGPELASTEYPLPNSVLRCIAVLYRMLFLCFGLFE